MSWIVLVIFIGYLRLTWEAQDFDFYRYRETWKVKDVAERILVQMWTYHIEANRRIAELNPMRFMYEESPHYEQGYVFAEIIERYKKMVEHYKRLILMRNANLNDHLDKLERMHKNYLEILHLVSMMHEVKLKYRMVEEFKKDTVADPGADVGAMLKVQSEFLQQERERERERKQELRLMSKIKNKGPINMSVIDRVPGQKRQPYNTRFPLDYGWDIDSW